jgi:hypothetical protein
LISLPSGTKIFQFPEFAILTERPYGQVSLFGHLRIKAYSAAPRSFSQPYHVLHRLSLPRHPPCTLNSLNFFLIFISYTLVLVNDRRPLRSSCRRLRSRMKISISFYCSSALNAPKRARRTTHYNFSSTRIEIFLLRFAAQTPLYGPR